jgi:hypothetical protein
MDSTPEETQPEDATSPATEQPTESAAPSETAPAKKRSTAEKYIVRGLIAILVIFAAIEARAKFGFDQTRDAVKAHFDDNKNNSKDFKVSDMASKIKFFPSRNIDSEGSKHWVNLKWFSFVKGYEIKLIVDDSEEDDPVVLSFETPEPEADPEKKPVNNDTKTGDEGGGPGGPGGGAGGPGPGAGPGGGGPGGSGSRPKRDPQAFLANIMKNDKDEDGKLTIKEIEGAEGAEFIKRFFERADKDKDGVVTKEDLEKAMAEMRAQRKKRPKGKRKRPEAEKTPKATKTEAKTTPQKTTEKKTAVKKTAAKKTN